MAEPISILTGVAGLIKNSYAIIKLINSVRDAPTQAAVAATEVAETRTILGQLQNFLLRFETADKSRTAQVQVDQLVDVISGCVATFSEFEAALDKIAGSSMTVVGRAKWAAWDEEKIAGLIARLQRHKASLSLVVIILTGETQFEMRDLLERLNVAVDGSSADTLRRLQPMDNKSVTSRKTTDSQAGLDSDTGSIVTVIHSPQVPALIPDKRFQYEFEPELKRSRPYRKMSLEVTISAISLTENDMRGWSVLSGYSLADVSNMSVVSLTISLSEVHNPNHYDLPREWLSPVTNKPPEDKGLKQQARQDKGKGLRLKDTWSIEIANVRAGRYKNQGRMAEAENMYRRVLAINEKSLGPEHESTLDTVSKLGLFYLEQCKWVAAEAMFQRALAGREKVLGPEHESTLNTVHNLGLVYNKQYKLGKAGAMLQRVLAGREKVLGPEHKLTLNTVHDLGLVYDKQDKLVEAEAVFQRALAGREKVLGPEHESTLDAVHNLGYIYDKQDKLVEAEAMDKRALAAEEKILGPEHELTLNTAYNLGLVYRKQGKLQQAEALFRRALDTYENSPGPQNVLALDAVYQLGHLNEEHDNLLEAEGMYRQSLDGYEKALGPDHLSSLTTVTRLGLLLAKQDKVVEAEGLCQRALDGYGKVTRPEQKSTYIKVNNITFYHDYQCELVETEAIFRQVLDDHKKDIGLERNLIRDMLNRMEQLHRR